MNYKNESGIQFVIPFKRIKDKSEINQSRKDLEKYIEELEKTNREFKAAFEFSRDGIVISDKHGICIKWNEAYCRITGIESEKLINTPPEELFKQKLLSESATLNTIKSHKVETTMPLLKNGKKVMITSIPVFDKEGEINCVIANVRDMTELVNLEAQIEREKELSRRYYSEILHLRSQDIKVKGMVAESSVMKDLVSIALRVAAKDVTILITGESGTGKEVLARAVHEHSEMKSGPFVKVNCSAIPENLLESELFGYEKGAFTSASKSGKLGIFEIASGGTLFLDEIGEMPLALQAKLLGVLQDRKFSRVGGTKELSLKARVIAATNRDLEEMIREKRFRKDLFYRINVVGLKIPSLNERKDDIPPLVNYFLEKLNNKYKTTNTMSLQVINAFMRYKWPGNVREMENLMERLVILAPNEQISLEMLPEYIVINKGESVEIPNIGDKINLAKLLANVERKVFEKLIDNGYNSYKMAEMLEINQSTVIRKMKKHGLKI